MLQKKYTVALLFRKPVFEVARLVFASPKKTFHIRKLSKETGLSTTAVISAVKDLKEAGVIGVEAGDVTTLIKADLESGKFQLYKRMFNLFMIEKENIITALTDEFHPDGIVLFGSFAKGEDVEESDVDILIITRNKGGINKNILENFEKAINRRVELHILKSLEGSSKEFKNAVANGIVLQGYLKVA